MPLFLRISATDWLEEQPKDQIPESWTPEDTVKLAPLLAEAGVDVLDVSSGGNHHMQHPHAGPAYQSPFAIKVKKAVGDKLIVGCVGSIETAQMANDLLEKDGLDFVTVGRGFQKNPFLVSSMKYILHSSMLTVGSGTLLGRGIGSRCPDAKPDSLGLCRKGWCEEARSKVV